MKPQVLTIKRSASAGLSVSLYSSAVNIAKIISLSMRFLAHPNETSPTLIMRLLSVILDVKALQMLNFLFERSIILHPPSPVNVIDHAWLIETGLRAKIEEILAGEDRVFCLERELIGDQTFIDIPCRIAFLIEGLRPSGLLLFREQREIALKRIVIMSAEVSDHILAVVARFFRQFRIMEREFHDVHAREVVVIAKHENLRPEIAKVFGDDFKVWHFLEEDIEKFISWGFNPGAIDCRRATGGDLPIGIESPEVIKTNHIIQ